MGCWGATRECFRSCGKGPHSEHYDAWLARERLRQLNAQTERNDKLQRQLAQMEMVVTQTQDILASYRDLDQMEADRTEGGRQQSVSSNPREDRYFSRVSFTAQEAEPVTRNASQSSAEAKAEFRARINADAARMASTEKRLAQSDQTTMKVAASADLDADDWRVASVAKERSRTLEARQERQRSPSPSIASARGQRQAVMDALRKPLPPLSTRDFQFSPPAPVPAAAINAAPKIQRAPAPFAPKDIMTTPFASTHSYPAPKVANAPARQ